MTSTKEDVNTIVGCAMTLLGIGAFIPITIVWDAFVLTKLWAWFAVPAFGLPVLTLWMAVGIQLIVSSLVPSPSTPKDENAAWLIIKPFFKPALLLLIGWVVTLVR